MYVLGCNTVYRERNKKTKKANTVISKYRDILSFNEARRHCFDAKVTDLCFHTIVITGHRYWHEISPCRRLHHAWKNRVDPSGISSCQPWEVKYKPRNYKYIIRIRRYRRFDPLSTAFGRSVRKGRQMAKSKTQTRSGIKIAFDCFLTARATKIEACVHISQNSKTRACHLHCQ